MSWLVGASDALAVLGFVVGTIGLVLLLSPRRFSRLADVRRDAGHPPGRDGHLPASSDEHSRGVDRVAGWLLAAALVLFLLSAGLAWLVR